MGYFSVCCEPFYLSLQVVWILVVLNTAATLNPSNSRHYHLRCPVYQFASYNNDTDDVKCRDCSPCRRGFELAQRCNSTSDTVCKPCQPGTYNPKKGGTCRPCTVCRPGKYTRRSCTFARNTACADCPRGTFSEKTGVRACVPCTACRPNQVKLEKCSRTHDTRCGPCEVGYFREFGSGACLSCSKCGDPTDKRVVAECAHTIGLARENKMCWPKPVMYKYDVTHADGPDIDKEMKESTLEMSPAKPFTEDSNFHANVTLVSSIVTATCFLLIFLVGIAVKLFLDTFCKLYMSRQSTRRTLSQTPQIRRSVNADISIIPQMDSGIETLQSKSHLTPLNSQSGDVYEDEISSNSEADVSALFHRKATHRSCDTFEQENKSFAGDVNTISNDSTDIHSDDSFLSPTKYEQCASPRQTLSRDMVSLVSQYDASSETDTSGTLSDTNKNKKKRRGSFEKRFMKTKDPEQPRKKPKLAKKQRRNGKGFSPHH